MGWELFSQYVRALHEARPAYFIYENNKSMANAIRESITQAFGFDPICINSALVSAQNRQRLYWVGKRNPDGTYSKVDVQQPADRGILLRHILEHGAEEQIDNLAAVGVGYRNRRENDGKLYRRFETHGEEKANAMTTVQTDSMVGVPVKSCALRGRKAGPTYEVAKTEKANTLTGNTQSSRIILPSNSSPIECIYEAKGGSICIKGKYYPINLPDGHYLMRHYSLTERKRLQTVPDGYVFPVSNTQAAKMLGNGWTVEVIKHLIMSAINSTEEATGE